MNIIIGAGLTGLSAAYHLNTDDYIVFEASQAVGGVANSFYLGEFTFDGVGHVLHFKQEYTLDLAQNLLPGNLHKLRRKSSIYFDGVYVPYPFQMNLYRLPYEVKMECLMGAIQARYEHKNGHSPKNFAEWILASLGEGIAKHFMFPYNEKIWTVPPQEMTTSWLGGFVPQPDLKAILDGAIRDRGDDLIGYNAEFWYPLRGGVQVYAEAFVPRVKNLRLSTPVESVDVEGKTVLAGGRRYPFTSLISTASIVKLVEMIETAPAQVRAAAQKLRANCVYAVLLGVGRPNISDQHWVYFPQKELIFYRIGFPSNLSPHMCPPGTSSICAEMAYRGSPGMTEPELIERTIADLTTAGVLRPDDPILVKHIAHYPNAYVLYDDQRDDSLSTIMSYLNAHQIYSAGRYGAWEYSSTEDAVLEGRQAAETVNQLVVEGQVQT